jgi:predicted DNA-binding transcriptional regulator AlpA
MKAYHVDQRRLQPAPVEPLVVPEAAAARLLGISPRSLWQLRHDGRGPRHAMIGSSVRYAVAELHRYLAEQTATTEGGAA